MTRNRFNQAKHQSTNSLSKSKAHNFFLEDIDYIDLKDTYQLKIYTLQQKKRMLLIVS